jgi:isopentenyl-diphosphate delta-isomerase
MDDGGEVILVDRNDVQVGTAGKLAAHRSGDLHRAVSVMVEDDSGRLLLQRRAAGKYHSAGLWSNTACGHPLPGETTHNAAERRLLAEMGIRCALAHVGTFVYRASLDDGLIEHEFDHVYVGRWNGTPEADPREVAEWTWVTPSWIRDRLNDDPARFSVWLPGVLGRVRPIP